MPRRLQVRELSEKEQETIHQTARSRTAAVREVPVVQLFVQLFVRFLPQSLSNSLL